ncbi:MAG TPA: hypothetical protein VFH27_16240 [Longimicrobiaceae bacterium]|nr:hypothetical protein [Longimicrobiaceae bacterium]
MTTNPAPRRRFTPSALRLAVLAVLGAAGLAAAYLWLGALGGDGDAPRRTALASFTEKNVVVEIALERDGSGADAITARFTPTRAGFHLYGKDLPRGGLDGIGRPTLVEIVGPTPRRAGAMTADRPVETLNVPLLGVSFPVYPAGPVTLRQPIALPAVAGDAELSVTYMACSDRTCLAPAIDRRIPVRLPAAGDR